MDDRTRPYGEASGDTSDNALPPASPPRSEGITFQRPIVVIILYLLNFVTGFSAIVGVVLAYIWRGEQRVSEWEQTHYTYLIRTFWIGLLIFIGFMVLFFGSFATLAAMSGGGAFGGSPAGGVLGMFAIMGLSFLGAIWFIIRCVLSLVKAGNREPMPNPETWWL